MLEQLLCYTVQSPFVTLYGAIQHYKDLTIIKNVKGCRDCMLKGMQTRYIVCLFELCYY